MSVAQENGLPPLIDREIFFGDPEISGGQLSPDGTWISFIKPYNGTRNIWVKKFDEPFENARPLTADDRPIPGYFWSRDGHYVLYVQDKGGNENFHIYAVDPSQEAEADSGVPPFRDLTPGEEVRAMIYSLPKKIPGIMYVGLNDRDPAWHDLYKLDIQTGERTLVRQNTDRITSWEFDLDGNLRLATRTPEDGRTEVLRVDDSGFTKIYECGIFETCSPIRFLKNSKYFYMITNKGKSTDLTMLAKFNTSTDALEIVELDPEKRVDFGGAWFSDATDELVATSYTDDKRRRYFRDPEFEADFRFLEEQFPGMEIGVTSNTTDEKKWLVSVSSDTDPGSVYLFDRSSREVDFQYRPRPEMPIDFLAAMEPIRYKSFDGMEIPAYLTLPKGLEARDLPLIVFPHGGPWARDYWGYNPYAQFLANRGYAVLMVNFRGSTGFGKAFLNAGNNQWGERMQEDLTAGVAYLVDQGIADPENVGIMGGSYGGYATLAGLTFTPEVYAAGVSIVGPSNLFTLLESLPPYWEAGRTIFYERMGNPETTEGKAQIRRQSPLFHAHQIQAPLMVVQGANDPRVKQRESDQIVVAMRELELPVTYLVAKDEGHGFRDPINNMAFLAASEKFLSEHLGGRYQESMKDAVARRLDELMVDVSKVTLPKELDVSLLSAAPPNPAHQLKSGKFNYEITLSLAGKEMKMNLSTLVMENDDAWVITDRLNSMMGTVIDKTRLKKESLQPIAREIEQGPVKVNLEYTDEKINGIMKMGDKDTPIDKSIAGALFAEGAGTSQVLACLPLEEGYSTHYRTFDTQTQEVQLQFLEVKGKEEVTVPAGTFTAYRLEVKPANGDPGGNTIWVDASSRVVVRTSTVVPEMGGAEMVGELLPPEESKP